MARLTTTVVALACVLAGAWLSGVHGALGASPRPVDRSALAIPDGPVGPGEKHCLCKAADCGTQVTVYIHAKIRFCNCSTGVADDAELDRVSDFELIGNHAAPQGPGRPISVAWMKGRSRPFDAKGAMGADCRRFRLA